MSSPWPPKILSVVAETLPPFRLRSQAIARLSNCGNICETWSTLLMSTCLAPGNPEPDLRPFIVVDEVKKKYRTVKNMMAPAISIECMETVSDMLK